VSDNSKVLTGKQRRFLAPEVLLFLRYLSSNFCVNVTNISLVLFVVHRTLERAVDSFMISYVSVDEDREAKKLRARALEVELELGHELLHVHGCE
jgi:hypothetical protein